MLKEVSIVVVLGCLIAVIDGQLLTGTPCLTTKAEPGSCKVIRECDVVVKAIQKDKSYKPLICDVGLRTICCPNPVPVAATPAPVVSNRISGQKCREYGENIFESIVITDPDGSKVTKRRDRCGHKAVPLIVGGEDAKEKEFPHMALIGYVNEFDEESYACGGTLISHKYIMSAAHCSSSGRLGPAKLAKLGDVRRSSPNSNTFKYNIIEIINHPEYKKKQNYHDIALFKLNQSVLFNDYVMPACLPQSDVEPLKVLATGWGITGFAEAQSDSLLKVTLEVFKKNECMASYQPEVRIPQGIDYQRMICAGSRTESKDTCNGDSGGPIQVYNNDVYCMYTAIGVTSFGTSFCGSIGFPGVYTRVFYYLDWIESIVFHDQQN